MTILNLHNMFSWTYAFLVCSISLAIGTAAVKWSDFRVKFSTDVTNGFYQLPRLQSKALEDGWMSISRGDCTNAGRFNGYRYVPRRSSETETCSVVILFDKQGTIAGLQMLMPYDIVMQSQRTIPDFQSIPMYQNETLDDVDYLVVTAYFQHPDTICSVGRTSEQLEEIGTGQGLWFQNGSNPTCLIQVPKKRQNAINEGWTANECVSKMGFHNFYRVDTWDDANCSKIQPVFLLYNKANESHGFGWFFAGKNVNKYFENLQYNISKLPIGPNPPLCFRDYLKIGGGTSMHVYFQEKPWEFTC